MSTKKIALTIAFVLFVGVSAFAQRFAYVNTEYILKNIPEYGSAQKQIEDLSTKWQKDVDDRYASIERMYKAYQQDQPMLNDASRKRREDEIVQKERETKDYQRKLFSPEGDLFKERMRLIKPIQDRVTAAIQSVAQAQNLDIIIDKGAGASILYANPSLDKSNEVITKLGYKPDPSLAK